MTKTMISGESRLRLFKQFVLNRFMLFSAVILAILATILIAVLELR